MKAIGVVRKLDPLGRIVLPIELRTSLKIEEGDSIEIHIDGELIYLRKYFPRCIFCGSEDDVLEFMGKKVCIICKSNLKRS